MSHHEAANAIRLTKRPVYMICTGAGAGIQEMLWEVPGISDVLCGAEFPYAKEMTDTTLGFEPTKYVSPETAVDLAMTAFYKVADRPGAVGLGLTAAVASSRAHRGDHRVYIATVSDTGCRVFCGTLQKGEGQAQRLVDGALCNALGFATLVQSLGLDLSLTSSPYAKALASLQEFRIIEDASALLTDRFFERPYFTASGKRELLAARPKGLILPGAFNPPHEGHHKLAAAASEEFVAGYGEAFMPAARVTYAVSQKTPHKGSLTVTEMLRRAKLLTGLDRMFTREDPLYIDKARQHPGSNFIVGVDAVSRLLDPAWGLNPNTQFQEFQALGTHFYVAGRTVDGVFKTLNDLPIPPAWRHLFHQVPGRWDISSSAIRAA